MPDSAIYDEKSRRITEERKRFLKIVLNQDGELYDLLDETSNDIQKTIRDNSPRGEVTRPKTIERLIPYALATFGVKFGEMLVNNNVKVVNLVTDSAVKKLGVDFSSFPRYQRVAQIKGDKLAEKVADDYLTGNVFGSDFAVGEKIVSIQQQYLKTVKDIIRVGLQESMSAKQIALNIDNVIMGEVKGGWVGPFDWYRKRYGFKVAKDISRLPGSVSYQSYRIARTEINDAYRRSTIMIHSKSPWNRGFRWVLSSAHPEQDICDDYDGQVFEGIGDLPNTHPNCFCDVIEIYEGI